VNASATHQLRPLFQLPEAPFGPASPALALNVCNIERSTIPVDQASLVRCGLHDLEKALPSCVATPMDKSVVVSLPGTVARRNLAPRDTYSQVPQDAIDHWPVLDRDVTMARIGRQWAQAGATAFGKVGFGSSPYDRPIRVKFSQTDTRALRHLRAIHDDAGADRPTQIIHCTNETGARSYRRQMSERILMSRTSLSMRHCPACAELAGKVNGVAAGVNAQGRLVAMLAVFNKVVVLPLFCCVAQLSLIISDWFLINFENQFYCTPISGQNFPKNKSLETCFSF